MRSETKVLIAWAAVVLLVAFLVSCGSPSVDDTWLYKTL